MAVDLGFNFDERLEGLYKRRAKPVELGSDSRLVKKAMSTRDYFQSPLLVESYLTKSNSKGVQYALGAMEAVGDDSTRISYREGDRVAGQLERALAAADIPVEFKYQGSVPLDIHIDYSSDIDLLVLHREILGSDPQGTGSYVTLPGTRHETIRSIRVCCESALPRAFYAATVDTSGDKAISISGGSLQRKVDVVPATWFDTKQYQITKELRHRDVDVWMKSTNTLFRNAPFLHQHEINSKDLMTVGGAKRVIRLLKSLIRDSKKASLLKSYEVASLVWHFPNLELITNPTTSLELVITAFGNLTKMAADQNATMNLRTPDGTRNIIDSPAKLDALKDLRDQVEGLAGSIFKERQPFKSYTPLAALQELRTISLAS